MSRLGVDPKALFEQAARSPEAEPDVLMIQSPNYAGIQMLYSETISTDFGVFLWEVNVLNRFL